MRYLQIIVLCEGESDAIYLDIIFKMLKEKNPDVTYYQIVYKMSQGLGLEDDFIKGLSIVCENFGYGCKTFPTFNIEQKDMVKTIRDILAKFMPF